MLTTLTISLLVLAARAHPHARESRPIIRRDDVPLSDINEDLTYDPTVLLTQTYAAGVRPSGIPSAPKLPSRASERVPLPLSFLISRSGRLRHR